MTMIGLNVIRNIYGQQKTLARCVSSLLRKRILTEHYKVHTLSRNNLGESPFKFKKMKNIFFGNGPSIIMRLGPNTNSFIHVRLVKTGIPSNNNNVGWYAVALVITMIGMSYAGVPLFKIFCQQFGLGGNTEIARQENTDKVVSMEKIPDRRIEVLFVADRSSGLQWNFRPQQDSIEVSPGETALAFYTANNPTDKPIVGVATYSVVPYQAAVYFHKIQCFCFEEQILNPHEQVDMPVFFYIDPEYDNDPELEKEDRIVLSYTFFEAKEGMSLPLPGYN